MICTTGFSDAQKAEIGAAAKQIAVVFSSNMSVGVNLLFKRVPEIAKTLGPSYDIDIVETHHRFKKDAPSGTALQFARIVQDAMKQTELRHGREGLVGERPPHEIGIHALRVGDNVGEHTIIFSTLGETLELVHKGHSRDSYAHGALAAAKYLAGKGAGRYSMKDVLGLE